MHFGCCVEKIEVHQGYPKTMIELDCVQMAAEQKRVILAAGVASEQVVFGDYNHEACRLDQEMISETGGGTISNYLLEASRIVRLHESCFRRLRKRLTERWIEEDAAGTFQSGPSSLSFELLSRDEIRNVFAG
jgi:hypothetical protein